jgi:MFS family permease
VGTTLGEGAANDWLALALVDTRGASQSLAALAFAGFNAAMLVGRLVGGSAIDRFGRTAVVRVSGATAAVGVLLLCLVPSLPVALAGSLLWGLGLSVVFPAGMSAAGEAVPGRGAEAIAVVATIGYGGFLLGPPLLGFLAESWGLDRALLVVAALAVMVAVLAGAVRDRRPAEAARSVAEPVEEPAAC